MDWRELVDSVLNTGAGLVGQKYQADASKSTANAAARAAAANASKTPWLWPVVIVVGVAVLGFVAFKAFSK